MPLRTKPTKYFNNNKVYTFTINPDNEYQFYKESQLQSRLGKCIFNTLYYLRQCCKDCAIFKLTIESSLPVESSKAGNGPRIHFHGTIKFTDSLTFLLNRYHVLMQNFKFEIDTIEDEDKWENYCSKDESLFKPLMEKYQFPYKIENETDIMQVYLLSKHRKLNPEEHHPFLTTGNILEYH